jgi:putative hydrolase of the HAD superfamily
LVKNVIFDVGGVLVHWNPVAILEGFYADPGDRKALHEAMFLHPDWRAFNLGELTEPAMIERIATRTRRDAAELGALLDATRESLDTKPDTVSLLRSLQARGVPLFCISDMPSSVYAYLRKRHDFWNAFSGIAISGELGVMKPGREIFEHLLGRHDLRPAECVFIDDMPANAEGARNVGLHAIRFLDSAQCARDLEALLSPRGDAASRAK